MYTAAFPRVSDTQLAMHPHMDLAAKPCALLCRKYHSDNYMGVTLFCHQFLVNTSDCRPALSQQQAWQTAGRPTTSLGTTHAPPAQALYMPAPLLLGPPPNQNYPSPLETLPVRSPPGSQSAGALQALPERHPPLFLQAGCCPQALAFSTRQTTSVVGECCQPGGIVKVRAAAVLLLPHFTMWHFKTLTSSQSAALPCPALHCTALHCTAEFRYSIFCCLPTSKCHQKQTCN